MIKKYNFTADDFKSGRFENEFGDTVQVLISIMIQLLNLHLLEVIPDGQTNTKKSLKVFPKFPILSLAGNQTLDLMVRL